jgi:hypothetical protein
VGQRLLVVRDRGSIDRDAELLDDRQGRQLPQAAEQALGAPADEHHLAARLDPHVGPREQRKVALLLPRRDDRKLGLAPGPCGHTVLRDRAGQAAR